MKVLRRSVIEFLDARPECMSKSALIASVAEQFNITKGNARYYVTRVWSKGVDVKREMKDGGTMHHTIPVEQVLNKILVDKGARKKGPPQMDAMLNQIMGNAGYGREGKI